MFVPIGISLHYNLNRISNLCKEGQKHNKLMYNEFIDNTFKCDDLIHKLMICADAYYHIYEMKIKPDFKRLQTYNCEVTNE